MAKKARAGESTCKGHGELVFLFGLLLLVNNLWWPQFNDWAMFSGLIILVGLVKLFGLYRCR